MLSARIASRCDTGCMAATARAIRNAVARSAFERESAQARYLS